LIRLALFDMDGTLSNDTHRQDEYRAGKYSRYWDKDLIMQDPVWQVAVDKYHELESEGWTMGILTARREDYNIETTHAWLEEHGLYPNPIILRPNYLAYLRPPQFKTVVVQGLLRLPEVTDVVLYDNDALVVEAIQSNVGGQHVVHCTWDIEVGEPA
jgi:hypothetical protein